MFTLDSARSWQENRGRKNFAFFFCPHLAVSLAQIMPVSGIELSYSERRCGVGAGKSLRGSFSLRIAAL